MDPLTDERIEDADIDLDAALQATYEHRDRLMATHRRRSRGIVAGGALLLAAGGVIVGLALRDDPSQVRFADDAGSTSVTAPATSVAPALAGPAVPEGFTFESLGDGLFRLTRDDTSTAPSPSVVDPTGADDGVVLGGGGAVATRVSAVAGHTESPAGFITVKFACVGGSADRLDEATYRLDGGVVTIDARITSERGDTPCSELDGAVTPLPGIAVTDPVEVVAGPL